MFGSLEEWLVNHNCRLDQVKDCCQRALNQLETPVSDLTTQAYVEAQVSLALVNAEKARRQIGKLVELFGDAMRAIADEAQRARPAVASTAPKGGGA